jgi:hypothetical protein
MSFNIKSITIGKTKIPNIPFIWYRENHITCPINKIEAVDHKYVSNILQEERLPFGSTNYGNCFLIEQRNVLENANLYISFHSYLYYLSTKQTVINRRFNRSYNCKCITLNKDGIIYQHGNSNLKNNQYISGNVYIHHSALSPPNHFKFKVKEDMKEILIIVHGYCNTIKDSNVTCIYKLINDINN